MAMFISLFDLANMSIGTPEVGAVNFSALHTLLHAILQHLNIRDVKAEIPEEERSLHKPPVGLVKVEEVQNGRVANVYHQLERKVLEMEKQLEAFNKLPTAQDFLGRTKAECGGTTPVEDMWQMMQMKKKLEANEDGVSKTMTLIQELAHEISSLRESQCEVEGQLRKVAETMGLVNLQDMEQRLSDMERKTAGTVANLQKELESIQKQVKDMEENLARFPSANDLNNIIHLEELCEALVKCQNSKTINGGDKPDTTDLGHLQGTTDVHTNKISDLQEKMKALCQEIEDLKEELKPDRENLEHIQNTMLQLKEDCGRLNKTTGSLIQDNQLKQEHINILYQSVEKLEENKVDKEHTDLQRDVKSNKLAEEGKVSQMRFDETTEQLSSMIQDLLGRVSGQEQDWQKMLEKINLEMQSKLDRMELDPFKNKLEDRWKEIRQLLKERPAQYESDEAAGIRKQLITRFHCISCDRPVNMMVPGPQILTIPTLPGLPSHRSNRPYTVFELEQVRQHGRSNPASVPPQLECRKLLTDYYCTGDDYLSLLVYQHRYRSDHIPELSDYGYMSSSRSCGGSHTLTSSHRRYTRLHGITPCALQQEGNIMGGLKQGVVDLQGLDGHIYRGRMDIRLPAIHPMDGNSKCAKISQGSETSLASWDISTLPPLPQSAKHTGHNSETSEERPCSASLRHHHAQADNLSCSRKNLELRIATTIKQQCAQKLAP